MLTTCGNPQNILSVGTTYLVGIGGPCSAYGEWTPYSQYPAEHRQALFNGCSNSSVSVTVTPSSASVYPTPTPQVSETPSGAKYVSPSDVIITMTAIIFMLYFL